MLVQSNKVIEYIELEALNNKNPQLVITNQTTKEKNIITYNRNKKAVTSSLTGITLSIDEILSDKEVNSHIMAYSSGSYSIHKISYAKLKSLVGDGATVAGLASILVSVMGWVGIPVLTPVAVIVTLLASVTGVLSKIMKGSPKHGLYIKIKHGKRKISQGRYSYYIDSNSIEKIGTY